MDACEIDALDARDMARLAAGADAALNCLMRRHGERLFQYLIRLLQDEADAADLAQEAFVRVYQNRARFDPRLKFTAWLYAIATNLVRNQYRWRTRHPQVSLDAPCQENGSEWGDRFASPVEAPDQSARATERAQAIRQAVAALPEQLRMPLILAAYEEKSQAEIAAILGCTVKAVETRIRRARQQLRVALADFLQQA